MNCIQEIMVSIKNEDIRVKVKDAIDRFHATIDFYCIADYISKSKERKIYETIVQMAHHMNENFEIMCDYDESTEELCLSIIHFATGEECETARIHV